MDEEVNLRDLFETLIRGKRIIIGFSLASVIIAGIFSFFIMPVNYEARALIIFDKKFMDQQGLSIKSYNELIYEYTKIKIVYDSLQLDQKGYTVSSLKNSVKTMVDDKSNQIEIISTGSDPKTIQEIVNELGENSVIDFKNRLIDDKNRQIIQLQVQLKDIERQIADNPKLLWPTDIRNQGGQVIQVPQVNPMYERLAGRWDQVNSNLNQLKSEKDYLEKGIQTGGKGLYILYNKAPLPEDPVSPRKILNMALAGVLGLMVSVFVVFFLEFWRRSAPNVEK